MFSIPYCMEINDIPLFIRKGYTGEQYYRSVIDQFDALYADSAKQPRVMGIPLHPMITGQPLRIKYLAARARRHEEARGGLVRHRRRDRRRLPARQPGKLKLPRYRAAGREAGSTSRTLRNFTGRS